jgi:putative membrane protein
MGVRYSLKNLLRYLQLEIIFSFFMSSLVYYLYEHQDLNFLSSFGMAPVTLLGTILSVFLAFRNNNSYGRWWEARQLWGDLLNTSRLFKAQVAVLISAADDVARNAQQVLLGRQVAFAHLLRMQLRGQLHWKDIESLLSERDLLRLKQAINPASELMVVQAEHLTALAEMNLLTDYRLVSIIGTIERFYNIMGGCERIKNTPFPREYDSFIRILIWILIVSMPIYFLSLFSDNLSKLLIIPLTVGITIIIGFANKAGEILEDPFENRVHDIPMSALCNTIEKNVLDSDPEETVSASKSIEPVVW